MRFHHNTFVNNRMDTTSASYGSVFDFSNAQNSAVQIDSNWFQGNSSPVIALDPFVPQPTSINARNNWWGHESGPYHPARNPDGQGDSLLLSIIQFEPWLTSPPDTARPVSVSRAVHGLSTTWEVLSIYPNPFNAAFRVDVAGFADHSFKIELFNLLGRREAVLHQGRVGGGALQFDAPPTLANGIYFLRVSDSRRLVTEKVILLK
jgi:hypothetical protein